MKELFLDLIIGSLLGLGFILIVYFMASLGGIV